MTTVAANAKINLWLRIAGTTDDGYHELETIFQSVGLADELTFRVSATEGIAVDMSYEGIPPRLVPSPEDNLVWRAAREMTARAGDLTGLDIDVVKRIPTGGGLGGGSADAAATLVVLNGLLRTGLSPGALVGVARGLGSDTAFCVAGGTAVGTGRGEKLVHLQGPSLALVLGLSDTPLATRDVYERWRPAASPGAALDVTDVARHLGGGPAEIAGLLRNDLEAAAFELRPELRDKKAELTSLGALGALVSGSGPTIFGVCEDEDHAAWVATRAREAKLFDRVATVHTRPACVEPV